MKKIVGLIGAGALLLSVAAPVFASFIPSGNFAVVNTATYTSGASGSVSQKAFGGSNTSSILKSGSVTSGALVGTAVNTNVGGKGGSNVAFVTTSTTTTGVSGNVSQTAFGGSNNGSLTSGSVHSDSTVITLVNTSVKF
jgi:hypothetical protein